MGKVTQVNNNDSGLTARTNYNEAMKTVESDSSLSGSGTTGDPLKVVIVGYFDNINATTAPTITNDSSENYEVGSTWIDITNDNVYKCVDATVGAAVWEWLNKPSVSRQRQTLAVVTNNITLDWNNLNDLISNNRVSVTANATLTYVNIGSAEFCTFKVGIANLATLTFPSGSISSDANWSALVWTPPENGKFTISIYKTGSEYEVLFTQTPAV